MCISRDRLTPAMPQSRLALRKNTYPNMAMAIIEKTSEKLTRMCMCVRVCICAFVRIKIVER